MARKRMISPDIWTDEKFLALPTDEARLLFIGMLNFADDEGIFKNCPLTIKCQCRAASPITLGLLEDYIRTMVGLQLLEEGNNKLLRYKKWHDHQKINHPTPSKYIFEPVSRGDSSRTNVGLPEDSRRTTSQYSIDKNSIDKNSIDKRSKKNPEKQKKQDFTFDSVYSTYPIKKAKQASEKSFNRIPKKAMKAFIQGLEAHIEHWERYSIDKQYIPHLSTFINQKRWEDELIPPTNEQPKFKDEIDKQLYDRNKNIVKETKRMTAYIKHADEVACDEVPDLNEMMKKESNAQPLSEAVGQFMAQAQPDTSTNGE